MGNFTDDYYYWGLDSADRRLNLLREDRKLMNKRYSLPDSYVRCGKDITSASQIRGSQIVHADFQNRNLRGWDFGDCMIVHANFRGADLRDTKWSGAMITHGNFQNADLRGSNLLEKAQIVHLNDRGAKKGKWGKTEILDDLMEAPNGDPKPKTDEVRYMKCRPRNLREGDVYFLADNERQTYTVLRRPARFGVNTEVYVRDDSGRSKIVYHDTWTKIIKVIKKEKKTLREDWRAERIQEALDRKKELEAKLSRHEVQKARKDLRSPSTIDGVQFSGSKVAGVKKQILEHTDMLFRTITHDFKAKEIRALADWLIDNRDAKVSMPNLADYLVATNQESRMWCGLKDEYMVWADAMNRDALDSASVREFLVDFGPLGGLETYRRNQSILKLWDEDPQEAKIQEEQEIRDHYEAQKQIREGQKAHDAALRALQDEEDSEIPEDEGDGFDFSNLFVHAKAAVIGVGSSGAVMAAIHFFF